MAEGVRAVYLQAVGSEPRGLCSVVAPSGLKAREAARPSQRNEINGLSNNLRRRVGTRGGATTDAHAINAHQLWLLTL